MSQKNKSNNETDIISLMLDEYNDLFSDFDPRPNSKRSLSDDFLDELARASYDKKYPIHLELMLPKRIRRQKMEQVIKKRLSSHFQKHFNMHKNDRSKIVKKGMKFWFAGFLFMLFTTYLHYTFLNPKFYQSFLIILLEPAGWFSFWEGLNLIFFESQEESKQYYFYEKMSKAKIKFKNY